MMRVVLLLCSLAFVAGIPIPERRWTSISDHWQINLSDQSDNLKNAYNLYVPDIPILMTDYIWKLRVMSTVSLVP